MTAFVGTAVSNVVRNLRLGPTLAVLDKVQNFSDATKLVAQLIAAGTINHGLAAGLLISIVPFGRVFSSARIITESAEGVLKKGVLNNAADALTDGFKALRGSGLKGQQLIQSIGDLGAISVAKKLGFKVIDKFPVRQAGFDGLFRKGDTLIIVEAKGGTSALSRGQMSKQWINDNIDELESFGYPEWADQLRKARDTGKLQGLVTKTRVSQATDVVSDPKFTLKAWDDIGATSF